MIFVLYLFVWENTIYRSEFYLAFFSSFFLFVRKRLGFSHLVLSVLLCYLASDFGTYFLIFINPQSRTRGKTWSEIYFYISFWCLKKILWRSFTVLQRIVKTKFYFSFYFNYFFKRLRAAKVNIEFVSFKDGIFFNQRK